MKDKYSFYYKSFHKKKSRVPKVLLCFFVALLCAFIAWYGTSNYFMNHSIEDGNRKTEIKIEYAKNLDEDEQKVDEISNDTEVPDTGRMNATSENADQEDIGMEIAAIDRSNSLDLVEKERNHQKVKGIYVPASKVSKEEDINQLITLLDETELNALVIDIKDDTGRMMFASENELAVKIGANTNRIKDIDVLIDRLKEHGIYCIARVVAFKDPYLAERRQDLAILNSDGTIYRDNSGQCWVNPYEREVWDYLVDIGIEAGHLGFDEIQYDYIRFSTGSGMNQVEFGHDSKDRGKEDVILDFTRYAYVNLKAEGLFVSADVYGTIISSNVDAALVGQNYVEMTKYLDYICPMIYPSHFGRNNYGIEYPDLEPGEIVGKVLGVSYSKLALRKEDENCAIVRPWLQDFTATWLTPHQTYGGEQVREQIDAVYEAGYEEWFLWNSICNYSKDGLLKD